MSDFAEQIKRERRRLRLSQARAAELLGVSPRTLWDWEHGKKAPHHVLTQNSVLEIYRRTTVLESQ